MRKTLPPLSTLIAFEAAGRLASFTKAAEELHLTQAAVSKQINALERAIGRKLFERSHRAVQLTAEGREYLHTIVAALSHINHATLELKADAPPVRLRVATDLSVADLWLMPRLDELLAQWPDLALHMVVSDAEARCLANEVDVAILHGEGQWAQHDSELLFPEVVFPVCSPGYLAAAGAIASPADLAGCRLIDLEDDNWNWMNWRIFLTDQGIGLPATFRAMTIGNYPLVLEAARRGHGVALAWQSLVEDDLATGRLVRPIAAELATRFGYYMAWPRSRPLSPVAAAFVDWARRQMATAGR